MAFNVKPIKSGRELENKEDERIELIFNSKEPKKVEMIIVANKKGKCFDCQRYLINPEPKEIFSTVMILRSEGIDICLDCSWKRNQELFREDNRLINWKIVFKIFKKLREREMNYQYYNQYIQQ